MKLQHNYTTVEQSKRLIEAGLPAETADCCLERVEGTKDDRMVTVTEWEENYDFYQEEDMFPCWSYGRLIELMEAYSADDIAKPQFFIGYNDHMVEDIVDWFERVNERQDCDFSCFLPDKPKPEPQKVENCFIRPFGEPCPIDNGIEVDIYNCTNCEHYFATASKSIICRKVEEA